MNGAPSLLKNQRPGGNYLNVQLIGTKSNRSAIGARVTVTANGRRMIDEVMGGGSYFSQSSSILHFGLGNATAADQVEVRWPSGLLQKVQPGAAKRIVVTEGSRN